MEHLEQAYSFFLIEHPVVFVVVVLALGFGWQYLKALVSSGFNFLGSVFTALTATVETTAKVAFDAEQAVQGLIVWAVQEGKAELLPLLKQLLDKIKAPAPASTAPAQEQVSNSTAPTAPGA